MTESSNMANVTVKFNDSNSSHNKVQINLENLNTSRTSGVDIEWDNDIVTDLSFSKFHITSILISILTYISDIVFASFLAYFYFTNDYILNFVLTIVFVVLSNVILTAFSMRWYIMDDDNHALNNRPSTTRWIIRIILLLLQLGQLLRYFDTFIYGVRLNLAKKYNARNKQIKFYRKMLDEDTDGSLLRLIHCFVHAAPLAVLQLTFFFNHWYQKDDKYRLHSNIVYVLYGAIPSWIVSISWGLTSYHRASRLSRDDKDKLTISAAITQFLWHFVSVASRIIALSLLACVFPAWFATVCLLHWFIMLIWLTLGYHQTALCAGRCEEFVLSIMLGVAYLIIFISPKDGPSRYTYLVYYLVCFLENTGILVVWCVMNNSEGSTFLYYGPPIIQLTTFALTIMLMLFYYLKVHPSGTSIAIQKTMSLSSKDCDSKDQNMKSSKYLY